MGTILSDQRNLAMPNGQPISSDTDAGSKPKVQFEETTIELSPQKTPIRKKEHKRACLKLNGRMHGQVNTLEP